jgi:hypothetical protein
MTIDPLMIDTITLYNRYSIGLPPFPPKVGYKKTVIKNVMWKDTVHNNSDSAGKSYVDQTVSITIPLEADIEADKKYITPADYAKLAVDDNSRWTLNIDRANPDIIVLGECPAEIIESYTITQLKRDYKTTDIAAVSDSTNQNVLPQWKVSGV